MRPLLTFIFLRFLFLHLLLVSNLFLFVISILSFLWTPLFSNSIVSAFPYVSVYIAFQPLQTIQFTSWSHWHNPITITACDSRQCDKNRGNRQGSTIRRRIEIRYESRHALSLHFMERDCKSRFHCEHLYDHIAPIDMPNYRNKLLSRSDLLYIQTNRYNNCIFD